MPFKAATYNVLADAYIRPDRYPEVPPELLRPDRRIAALARHVEQLDADLLCLQEVEVETFDVLSQRLNALGYDCRFEKKGQNKPDGAATFFRKSLFTLRNERCLDYHDASGHVALLLGLEHEGRLLGVANTHIRWDPPRTPRGRQVGLGQVIELLRECRAFTPDCRDWLICGDFNCTANSESVATMKEGGFGYAHAGLLQARSCVANGKARLIDYLFHSAGLRSTAFDPPVLTDDTALPSEEQPSDHVALVAVFEWAL